jgi:hypothetical protein
MDLAHLLATLQHEIQKSYDYVDEVMQRGTGQAAALRMALQEVEFDLPVAMAVREARFDPRELAGVSATVKRLNLPFSKEAPFRRFAAPPRRPIAGVAVEVEVVGPQSKLDGKAMPETLGRMKLTFKPILK